MCTSFHWLHPCGPSVVRHRLLHTSLKLCPPLHAPPSSAPPSAPSCSVQSPLAAPERMAAAAALSEEGFVLCRRRQYDAALECYSKALDLFRSAVGESHPDTITAYNRMGLAYYCTNGEGARAREMFAKVVAIRNSTLGANHEDTKIAKWWMDMCRG